MKKILLFFSFLAIIWACNQNEEPIMEQNNEPLIEEAYNVYRTLLYPLSSMNIVLDKTDTSLYCKSAKYLDLDSIGVMDQIIDECKQINKLSYTIEKDSFESGGLIFVDYEEYRLAQDSYSLLTKYGATGLYILGCPVFYNNNQNAFFEVSFDCGSWCGHGTIYFVEKKNGSWVITHQFFTWIS